MTTIDELVKLVEDPGGQNSLEQLDELIRSDKSVRESIPDRFYSVMLGKMTRAMHNNNWLELSLAIKCVKNSAGVFRDRFGEDERRVCEWLMRELDVSAHLTGAKLNSCVYTLQYFFNLIQGNQEAYESFITSWSLMSLSILSRVGLEQDLYDLASMILIYGCVEKKSAISLLDSSYTSLISFESYIELLNRLSDILVDKNYDFDDLDHAQLHSWSFKYLDFYFTHVYEHHLIPLDIQQLPILTRSNLFSLLNYKILKLQHHNRDQLRSFLSHQSLEFIMSAFVQSSAHLISNEDFDHSCRATKLLANSLADLLTLQEGLLPPDEIKSNLKVAQSNPRVFENVCRLFRMVHEDVDLGKRVSVVGREDQRPGLTTLKCELVRLIGIFVFENPVNQNFLVDNGLIHVISNNLDVDVDNPFLREWSIVALRHVLCAHDRK